MQVIPIPIASKLNSEDEPSSLSPAETPFIKNARLEPGVVYKRMGLSEVGDIGGTFIGGMRVSETVMLIAVATSTTVGHIYSWDMAANLDAFTALTSNGSSVVSVDPGYVIATGKYTRFTFTNHYDDTLGLITICTNGEELPYYYSHTTGYLKPILASDSDSTNLKAKYCASMKDTVYYADIMEHIGNATENKRRLVWSDVTDATDFTELDNYKSLNERGENILGLCVAGDTLYIGREHSIWNVVGGYGHMEPVVTDMGVDSHWSMVPYAGALYVCYGGKVMQMSNDVANRNISSPIHSDFAGSSAGRWDEITGVADPYGETMYFTSDRKVYCYSMKYGNWCPDEYDDTVDIISTLVPGTKPFSSWIGALSKHSALTINQEEIISDPVYVLGGTMLCIQNHFNEDRDSSTADLADGKGIEFVYQTQFVPMTENLGYGNIRGLLLEGKAVGSFTVYGFFPDTPQRVEDENWSLLGTVTLDSTGCAQFDVDSGRCRYATFKLVNNDMNYCRINKLALLVQRVGRR